MRFCTTCKQELRWRFRHTCRTCNKEFCENCLAAKKPEWICKACWAKQNGNSEAPKTPSPSPTPEKTKTEETKDDAKSQDYRSEIIPLSRVVRKWRLVSRRVRTTMDGPVHALHAMLVLFKDLWYIGRFLSQQERERWENLRGNLQLGFIKETKKYGNTSVSMGAAVSVSPSPSVGFLNCGSGGIKYQMYSVRNGVLALQAEYKPREGANLSAFAVGGYTPKTSIPFDKLQEALTTELKNAPWSSPAAPTPVYAFITGKIRQYWEDATEGERQLMEAKIAELFAPLSIHKLQKSYFMSQDEEGRLELLGSQTMYANLEKAGLLNQGTSVIGSLGIGQGSCQLMVMHSGQAELIAHRAGMGQVNELAKLSQTVIRELKDGRFSRFMDLLEGGQPVLALKSGCCLLLEQEPQLKAQLLIESPPASKIRLYVARNGQNTAVEWEGPSDVSVICGEAGKCLDAENLEIVYREDGQEWEGETELKEGELLYLAPLGEAFLGKTSGVESPAASEESSAQASGPNTAPAAVASADPAVVSPAALADVAPAEAATATSAEAVAGTPVEPVAKAPLPSTVAESQPNYRASIVPLSTMRDHWLMMSEAMEEKISEDKEGPVHALHATLVLLKNIYYFDQFLPDEMKSRWPSIRDKFRVGFIKDTKKHGNTSVSMGVAKDLNVDCVCLLNCGTGGIKYQMYLRAEGILFLVSEHKPKDGASPNALAVGGYKPKKGATFEATAAQLAEELSSTELPWTGKQGCAVYAFVTGSIRQSWEEADDSGKQVLEKEMERLFGPHNIQKLRGSFFMTQAEEGRLELLGARAMYGNLVEAGLLESGTNVIGSLGIGRGSCQWMTLGDNGVSELIGHQAGMSNLDALANLGQTVIGEYGRDPEKLKRFLDILDQQQYPVLALKSGCAILLQDEACAAELQAPMVSLHKTTVLISRNGQSCVVKYVAEGPKDRLCAEGGFELKTTENLEVLFRADGSRVKEAGTITEGERLVLAPLKEAFVPLETPPVVIHTPIESEQKDGTRPVKEHSKEKDYAADIIPLKWIPYKWWLATPLMKESSLTKEDEGPVHGLHATMTLLKKLWFLDQFLSRPELKEKWRTVRDRVHIGLIKDTKDYGNTSVSMGAAKTLLNQTTSIGFLNCGTGGIKYQLYTMKNGILSLKAEFKPKNGCSPNALKIGQFEPKLSVSFEETKGLLEKELRDPNLPWADDQGTPVYAFVTGTIRQYWEEHKESEGPVLEETMENLFRPWKIQKMGQSYFMTQDDEGRLELIGSQAMYANLGVAGVLDSGFSVRGSFGIGQGSCQWMIDVQGKSELIGHKAGMRNLPMLAHVGETVISTYANDDAKVCALIDTLNEVERPVIALKSGCMLLLENKEYGGLKQELVTPPSLLPRKEVLVARVKTPNSVKVEWKRNRALFCAEAALALSMPKEDFEEVYHVNGDPVCSDQEPIAENETLVVARLNEGFGCA